MINKAPTRKIILVEALTSGSGFNVVESALKMNLGVVFVTANPRKYDGLIPASIRGTLEIVVADTGNKVKLLAAVRAIARSERIGGIIGMTDGALENVAWVARETGFPFLDWNAARRARNKDRTRAICRSLGIPAPRFARASDLTGALRSARRIGFPCVLKASRGTGSAQVVLCRGEREVEAHARRLLMEVDRLGGVLLVEEFVKGPLYSMEAVTFGGKTRVLGFTDRVMGSHPYFAEIADSFPVHFAPEMEAAISGVLTRALRGLGIDYGFTHTEFVLSGGKPILIEVNPRLAGGLIGEMISIAYGSNIYAVVVDLALGKPPRIPRRPNAAASECWVYASKAGVVESVEGVELSNSYPGVRKIVVTSQPGQKIKHVGDYRGQIAAVLAGASTADLAASYARAAAAAITASVRP